MFINSNTQLYCYAQKKKQNVKEKLQQRKENEKILQNQGQVHMFMYEKRRAGSTDEKIPKTKAKNNMSMEDMMKELREERERKKICKSK